MKILKKGGWFVNSTCTKKIKILDIHGDIASCLEEGGIHTEYPLQQIIDWQTNNGILIYDEDGNILSNQTPVDY